ncbi:30S ribosomal protein S16 [Schleiferia thermophila]|jgi:small subunit ribosomal protein S16|uniref:Small ribosomal subunit protein bS16 n=1 Tax=Schleiferia thermophila TaxID=884107 RepID=A0A369A2X4_9FLAO|nr:30S ribosomal protein S16 [Schleiferia thermophila]KFD39042.1 30S ribosomal protein S16 [Schleiferia thermophila str. Yellowstone]PMB23316.1 30S ribosomal protein S16 [Fischerella thermalis CCMEE 5319]RCX02417.1 SSU ribosomal protein S16P [Schleiferia thermophila]GCD80700.1 30S ribosomal protein S16 [Schleiferia thermophila]
MAVRLRLQRHGRKGYPFYFIVAADSRSRRDGKFLEKIGIYNPNTDPATVEVNFESAVRWIQNGAQPTDTVRSILSKEGVLLKIHLMKGVAKGALTEEQAEEKFNKWLEDKAARLAAKREQILAKKEKARQARIDAERAYNNLRTEKKNAVTSEEASSSSEEN